MVTHYVIFSLASFRKHNIFEIYPFYSLYQYFISTFWSLWIMPLETFMYWFLCRPMLSFLRDIYIYIYIYIYQSVKHVIHSSCVWLCVTPWTVAHPAPLFMGFSRQEYWSGLPFPSPEDLPSPGIKPRSPALQADSLPSDHQGSPYVMV